MPLNEEEGEPLRTPGGTATAYADGGHVPA
jgi:hypothetical protein